MYSLIGRTSAWVKRWALWQIPRSMVIFVVTVDVVAVGATFATAFAVRVGRDDLIRFAVLVACAWMSIELTRHIERRRSYRNHSGTYTDTLAVWSFAALIVLPPMLASAMVLVSYAISWTRVQRVRSGLLYRLVFSCATVLCGTQAAVAVLSLGMHDYPGVPATSTVAALSDVGIISFAAALRWAINLGLVICAIALAKPDNRIRDLFSNFSEQILEAGAVGLALAAAVVVVANPFVMPGVVIAIVALHRGILVNQYQQASRVDAKTGLATAGWWHDFAERTMSRVRERGKTLGLLIIDLDHFKNFNDTYGHQHGDHILRAVAQELMAEIRDQDACGRWGGEEFVIVLPDVGDEQNLHDVAQRVRRRIESVAVETPGDDSRLTYVTASVGGALYPAEGIESLDELLLAADTALYAAKGAGRNTVRLSGVDPSFVIKQPESTDRPKRAGEAPSATA